MQNEGPAQDVGNPALSQGAELIPNVLDPKSLSRQARALDFRRTQALLFSVRERGYLDPNGM